MIDIDTLRTLLRYEPETGKLFWLPRTEAICGSEHETSRWNTRYAGTPADRQIHLGYARVKIARCRYLAHRVAWAIHTGAWPTKQIDHINGDRSDNRISNLREATHAENTRNKSSAAGSSSKYLGVHWSQNAQKWKSGIWHDGKQIHLGTFSSDVDAARAYDAEALRLRGQFAKVNLP
jgi:hypothetical protein